MSISKALATAGAFALALGAAPASAENSKIPPGNPCLKGNGNPCNGNNGNIGVQGNVGGEKVRIDKKPPPFTITMPAISDRAAFITQIGDGNIASVIQTAPRAYANVVQTGNRNEADVTQRGSGTHYTDTRQTGEANFARIQQDGPGQSVSYLVQSGNGNWVWSKQDSGLGLHNGAVMAQVGHNNDMVLHQNGSNNLAVLKQEGDGNGMTAVQNGVQNRLTWTQQGTNLSDLSIVQNGGQAIAITQTGTGPSN